MYYYWAERFAVKPPKKKCNDDCKKNAFSSSHAAFASRCLSLFSLSASTYMLISPFRDQPREWDFCIWKIRRVKRDREALECKCRMLNSNYISCSRNCTSSSVVHGPPKFCRNTLGWRPRAPLIFILPRTSRMSGLYPLNSLTIFFLFINRSTWLLYNNFRRNLDSISISCFLTIWP